MRTVIIDKQYIDGVSNVFDLNSQVTIWALGLEPEDEVTFWMVLLTDPLKPSDDCACPPLAPIGPQILDEVQLTCCSEPIVLSRERPYAVIDAPIGAKLRAKLASGIISTQKVVMTTTATTNISSYMRGCPCEASPL